MTPHEERTEDAALDREIERLFTAEPSADFQARVRTRLADEAIASAALGFWRPMMLRGAAALVLGAVVLMLLIRANRERQPLTQVRVVPPARESTPPTSTLASRSGLSPAPSHPAAGLAPRGDQRETRLARTDARTGARLAFPEALVSPSDAEGMRFLIAAVRAGRFDAAQQVDDPASPEAVEAKAGNVEAKAAKIELPDPIVITPLEIAPLLRATVSAETEGEAE
jgi:hypothetical protein